MTYFYWLFGGAIVLGLWGYVSERKAWNSGICPHTGEPWVRFGRDSHGGRGYKSGQHYIWISWPVDRCYGDFEESEMIDNRDDPAALAMMVERGDGMTFGERKAAAKLIRKATPPEAACPHIRSSDEGTHYCALAARPEVGAIEFDAIRKIRAAFAAMPPEATWTRDQLLKAFDAVSSQLPQKERS